MLHPQSETLLQDLLEAFQAKYPHVDTTRIIAAAHYADLCHDGQRRKSGDPYITHPLTVAMYCAQSGLDEVTILAALLHDVVEDCGVSLETISERYGPAVTRIIDGVTKAAKGPGESELTYHKLLSRAASDIRVLLIKVFDRLHNLRTLDAMPPEKQKKKARESFLYADIAERLGMWTIATEIQDRILRILHPEQVDALLQRFGDPELYNEAEEVRTRLSAALPEAEVRVEWRALGWFYDRRLGRLRTNHGLETSSFYDLLVLAEDIEAVYVSFGRVHRQFRVVPGQFLDFIANPKANDYQALHTMIYLRGRHKVRLVTREMHWRNESGVMYRFLEGQQALAYYRHYLEMLRQMTEERDLLVADVMAHLAPRTPMILVLTPVGDRIHLPEGATALDFAFHIHTQLGLQMTGAVVNGQRVGIEHRLGEGDLVEVLTSPEAGPERSWLDVPVTVLARQAVRRALARSIRQRAAALGQELLVPHLESLELGAGLDGRSLSRPALPSDGVLEDLLYEGPKALSRWIALDPALEPLGRMRRADFYAAFCPEVTERDPFFQVAECCAPLPGEPLVCELQRNQGGLLHRADCPAPARARTVPAAWAFADPVRSISLDLRAKDRSGLVSDILEAFRDLRLSLSSVDARIDNDEGLVSIEAVRVPVQTLATAGPRLRNVQGVTSVRWSLRPGRP